MKLKKRLLSISILMLSVFVISSSAVAYTVTATGSASSLGIHGFTIWFDVSNDFAFSNFALGDALPTGGTLGWSQDPTANISSNLFKTGGTDQDFLFLSTTGFQMTNGTILSFDIDAGEISGLNLIQFDPGNGSNIYPDQITLASSDINGASFSPAAVPIPGALWLLGSGLIGMVGVRRKLNKS